MSGFFGIIHRDSGAWRGFALTPYPDDAAGLIWHLRAELPKLPFVPGNEITLGDEFDQINLAPEDIGTLGLLTKLVFQPLSREAQMIAATAIALLVNTPYFFIEGTADSDGYTGWLQSISAPSVELAHEHFNAYCCERYPGLLYTD